jgi:hypothetical protein
MHPLIKKPSDKIETNFVKALYYGAPGIGKSTYGFTAPAPVLFDFDDGVKRVQPNDRREYVPITCWEDVESVIDSGLPEFESIIIDTAGKCLQYMAQDIIKKAPPKAKLSWQGNLTQQGYGQLKTRFQQFLLKVNQHKKHIIFLAHDKEVADGDVSFVRPDIVGASLGILLTEMDIVGYISMSEGKRVISHDPSEKYYGKNSCQLEPMIETGLLPIAKMIDRYKANQDKIHEIGLKYKQTLADAQSRLNSCNTLDEFNAALKELAEGSHIWDSKLVVRNYAKQRLTDLGYEYRNGQYYKVEKVEQAAIPMP